MSEQVPVREVSIQELVGFIEKLGPELDWSSRYMDLAATTTGAVFRSLGLDESQDLVAIGSAVTPEQLKTLERDLRHRRRSHRTVETYSTTWKRVASIAEDWLEAREAGSEDKFWEEADKFRDVRPRRRTTRASDPPDEYLRQAGTSPQ